MPSELEPLPDMAQSWVPNPEEEEEKKEAILPKKDLLDGPALTRRPSSSSAAEVVLESDLTACGIVSPNSQDSSSSSASSNSDVDVIIPPRPKEEHREDETAPVQQLQHRRQEGGMLRRIVGIPKLEVKLGSSSSSSSSGEMDGMKTPTSPGSKIPAILSCPPAPRRPISRPIYTKRKLAARRVLFDDHSDEIQSLFSANLTAGSQKMKKVKLPQPWI